MKLNIETIWGTATVFIQRKGMKLGLVGTSRTNLWYLRCHIFQVHFEVTLKHLAVERNRLSLRLWGYLQYIYVVAFWVIQCTHFVSRNTCANLQVLELVLLTTAVAKVFGHFFPLFFRFR